MKHRMLCKIGHEKNDAMSGSRFTIAYIPTYVAHTLS